MFLEDKNINPGGVAPAIGTLPHFAAWLERQNPDTSYCYTNSRECLIAQYLKAHKVDFHWVGPMGFIQDKHFNIVDRMPLPIWKISSGTPWNVGAAQKRARKILATVG